jgi:hypothetical protein
VRPTLPPEDDTQVDESTEGRPASHWRIVTSAKNGPYLVPVFAPSFNLYERAVAVEELS